MWWRLVNTPRPACLPPRRGSRGGVEEREGRTASSVSRGERSKPERPGEPERGSDRAPSKSCSLILLTNSEESEDGGGASGQHPQGGLDHLGTGEAYQADGKVSKSGEHLGAVERPDLGAIFVESDVAHPVQSILDRPVTAR